MTYSLLRKISTATVMGGNTDIMKMCLDKQDMDHLCYRVVGIANGERKGAGTEGRKDWQALIGSFLATNALTGEQFRSGVCFLPQFAVDMVVGQLTDEVTAVRFGFDVFAKFDGKSATKYTYSVKSLVEPAQDDPLEALAGTMKALPAPKEAATA